MDRRQDVGQRRMAVHVHRHLRPFELLAKVRLRGVNDDEIRMQRQDALDVRVDQRTDTGKFVDVRRIAIETAHRHHLRTGPDRKEHLGHGGDERDDPARWVSLRLASGYRREQGDRCHDHCDRSNAAAKIRQSH
jgi:hypothetical protein